MNGARQKLALLNQHVQGIFDDGPYTTVADFDAKSGEHTLRAKRLTDLPLVDWGIAVGGITHDLRSALNYVITALVQTGGGTVDRRHEFPIFDDPNLYAASDNKGRPLRGSGLDKIRGVDPTAQALIESLQPYNRPAPRAGVIQTSALWALHELNRVDKHQELIVPEPVVKSLTITAVPGITILENIAAGPLEDDAILVRWTGLSDLSQADALSVHLPRGTKGLVVPTSEVFVPMHLHATFDIAFSEAGPTKGRLVVDSLNQISSRAKNTVEAFAPFFP